MMTLSRWWWWWSSSSSSSNHCYKNCTFMKCILALSINFGWRQNKLFFPRRNLLNPPFPPIPMYILIKQTTALLLQAMETVVILSQSSCGNDAVYVWGTYCLYLQEPLRRKKVCPKHGTSHRSNSVQHLLWTGPRAPPFTKLSLNSVIHLNTYSSTKQSKHTKV
jgi:hypothetical protein